MAQAVERQIVQRARALIATPQTWTQDEFAPDASGEPGSWRAPAAASVAGGRIMGRASGVRFVAGAALLIATSPPFRLISKENFGRLEATPAVRSQPAQLPMNARCRAPELSAKAPDGGAEDAVRLV